ncbi:MAG TPA: hypothetical protein VMR70_18135 [Flavisolibacter sp.]|nr:hypothetical protein [Flavisolibacter sp.]
MALYHFNWQGKERTVSVKRVEQNMFSLAFIDNEIIQQVADHLLLEKAKNHYEYQNKENIVSLEAAASLVNSIEASVGKLSVE